MNGGSTERLYFDHAATTPLRPEVLEAMVPHVAGGFNPSSLHAEGRAARATVDAARATIARLLGASPREIVFTSGGSESDNLAILGAARAARRERGASHVVSVATEHPAVLAALEVLREDGFAVTLLPVDAHGGIAPERFDAALRPETALASAMLANNELGTVQPVAAFARAARQRGIVFHTDAVQAAGRLPLDVRELGVDLLTLAAHKCYGPKGAGLLYVRAGTPLVPLAVGGGQEAGLRAGTENVAAIVGFARALELAVDECAAETERVRALQARLEAGIAGIAGARVNGAGGRRLAHVSSVAFAGADAAALLVRLDLEGVAASAGSACAAGSAEPSHVIAALGAPDWVASGTIRLSLGKLTSEKDVERLLEMLPGVVADARVGHPDLGTSHSGPRLWDRSEVRF